MTTFTFGSKLNEKYNKNPGPGTYDQSNSATKTKTVAFRIGSSTREEWVSKTARNMPGPANYSNEH